MNCAGVVQRESYGDFVVEKISFFLNSLKIYLFLLFTRIGLPPVLNFGSDYLKEKVKECKTGKKNICLCITEPNAGKYYTALLPSPFCAHLSHRV
jgi:alkylation response protein AidB-like acyl-CoA dehydrogenase